MPQTRPPDSAEDTRSAEEQFLDLLLADDDLLQAEFDAIIAAEWPGPPPNRPRRRVRGDPDPGRRRHRATATKRPGAGRRPPVDGSARQRSPPSNNQEKSDPGERQVIARL